MEDKNKIIFVVVIAVLIIGIFYYNQKWQDAEKSFSNCADASLEETIAFRYCFGEIGIIKNLRKGNLEALRESVPNVEGEKFMSCIKEAQKDPIGTLRKMGFEEINSE